jgi:Leucine-rich repeat (LRR) protein
LKVLNLSSNMINKLNLSDMQSLSALQIFDISKNDITLIPPGTFREQKMLKFLDLSLNSLRAVSIDLI